ncbi:hypothetical protein [Spirosoma endophyticum]|nr:hypothetical protein [Spirosoma endophyticum]
MAQSSTKRARPDYNPVIIIDGKPLADYKSTIPPSTKKLTVKGQLTDRSRQDYPELNSTVIIDKAVISIIRANRIVASINWKDSQSSSIDLSERAQTGDRFVIQFVDVSTQTKDGIINNLPNTEKLYQIPIR